MSRVILFPAFRRIRIRRLSGTIGEPPWHGNTAVSPAYMSTLRQHAARLLTRVRLVISDAHQGLKDAVPKNLWRKVATMPGAFHAVRSGLRAGDTPRDGRDGLSFMGFSTDSWKKTASANPPERANIVGSCAHDALIIRLGGALVVEQTEE